MADAAGALSARSKVQAFLEAACSGDLDALRRLGSALDEEGKGAAAVAAGVCDANRRTALHFAAREGRTEVCQFLVEQLRLPVDPKDDDGETPLIHAARLGRLQTAEYLLDHEADPSVASNMGATALHHAAGIGHIELMKLLLVKGVDVESESDAGTPLVWAAGHGQQEAVKLLLEHNAKLCAGKACSVHVARLGRLETAQYLLGHGANPSVAASMGATALHHAAGVGHIELMKLLLAKGVDVESESDAGTPLVWAAGHGQQEAVKLLLEHNAKPNNETADGITSLLSTAAAGSLPCLEVLIQAGANPNVTAGGATPLHIAADIGNLEIIKCLLQAGGDPNTSDDDGLKPIQVAALRLHCCAGAAGDSLGTLVYFIHLCTFRYGLTQEYTLFCDRDSRNPRMRYMRGCSSSRRTKSSSTRSGSTEKEKMKNFWRARAGRREGVPSSEARLGEGMLQGRRGTSLATEVRGSRECVL